MRVWGLTTPDRQARHATIIAYLALFVALGGSSYAATKLTKLPFRHGPGRRRLR